MGEYFMYVNLDRREYFGIDALGGATKFMGIGEGPGARALGLLLTTRGGREPKSTRMGSWAGTRVVVAGDFAAPDLFGVSTATSAHPAHNLYDVAHESFQNIGLGVAFMVLEYDGPDELIEWAQRYTDVFLVLGDLATEHGCGVAESALLRQFGTEWRDLYEKSGRLRRPMSPGGRVFP